jgi:hypothetical protein
MHIRGKGFNSRQTWSGKRVRGVVTRAQNQSSTGTVTVTSTYYHPSSHVFHTVGPIVKNGNPTPDGRALDSDDPTGVGLAELSGRDGRQECLPYCLLINGHSMSTFNFWAVT